MRAIFEDLLYKFDIISKNIRKIFYVKVLVKYGLIQKVIVKLLDVGYY